MTLSSPVVTSRTATQVSSVCVGAAEAAGVTAHGTLIDILAAAPSLFKVKAGRTQTLKAAQGVVAGGRATHRRTRTLILIHTLVPLVVLYISLRTATAETSHHVLTAVLTAMVTATLIHVFTLHASGVQREAFPTVTVEAAGSVDTGSPGATHTVLPITLIVVDAGGLVLGEACRTLAGETADGVDTQELTVVLLGGTLIQIFAGLSVRLHSVSSGAGAQVAALCVLTQEVTGLGRRGTLIHINAGGAGEVGGITHVAVAAERSDGVDALAVLTQVWHHRTLIDVSAVGGVPGSQWAHPLVLHGARQWAELTLGSPAAPKIAAALRFGDTVPVGGALLTHSLEHLGETEALSVIDTVRSGGAGLEALVAHTAVAAHCVLTAPVLTDARLRATLIQVHAAISVRSVLHARGADTHESANQVLTGHALGLTVIQPLRTLILVSAHAVVVSQHVARGTHALVGTKSIDTAEGTQQGVQRALVDIFTGHHGARFEAFMTGALKASHHISTGPVTTGVSYRALIRVNTVDPGIVQVVAKGTLAAERSVRVDTDTVHTDAWVVQTLVHVLTGFPKSRQGSMAVGTQAFKGHLALVWAQLARVSPALAWHLAAAALGLGGVEGLGHRTLA